MQAYALATDTRPSTTGLLQLTPIKSPRHWDLLARA